MQRFLTALDLAFADPPAVDLSDGCSACFSEPDLAVLAGDPARIPVDLATTALRKSADHWSPEQWRALWSRTAPRVVREVLAERGRGLVDRELASLGKGHADLSSWPERQRTALDDALAAVLEVAVTYGDPAHEVTTLLGGLACAYDDLGPWLARLDALRGPQADAGVVRLALEWTTGLLRGEDQWFTWWWPADPAAVVREWVCSAAVRDRVRRFAAAHPGCKTASDVLLAYTALDEGARSPWYHPATGYDRWQAMGQPTGYAWLIPV
ncbi:hypothetical protein [Umezawaea tangerina]|uniref:Uncharacterized protein n=1 Tax=Umezawaea tangerina TaxID=84725 RepID=A0A2T0SXU3_9PSEU|nr:hypothetical protein [Umezawaea tangerina]PRY38237.1 hypothetical protein CLV43_109458 [Umezawaea tangerina]